MSATLSVVPPEDAHIYAERHDLDHHVQHGEVAVQGEEEGGARPFSAPDESDLPFESQCVFIPNQS